MITGVIIGLAIGAVAVVFLLLKEKSTAAMQEDKLKALKNNLSTMRMSCQEADANQTRFELEINKHKDLAILFPELVKQILSARTPEEFAKLLCRASNRLTGCTRIAIFLADVRGGKLGLVYTEGLEDVLRQPLVVKVGDGHVGFAAETGIVFEKQALETESELTKQRIEQSAIPGFVPDVAAPMTSQGILYGVICLVDVPSTASLPRERMRAIAAVGAAALESIRLLSRFESASDMDPDTGLPGRGRLEPILTQELERVRRFDSPLTVMELAVNRGDDADRFRAREFMSIAANHLKVTMRNIDTGLRTNASTLTLILPGTGEEGSESVSRKLLEDIPPLENDAGESLGTVRVRSVVIVPGGGDTPEMVLDSLSRLEFISPDDV